MFKGRSSLARCCVLTLDLGDLANVSLRFAVGDTVKIHTTQNPLRATGQHWAIRRDPKQVQVLSLVCQSRPLTARLSSKGLASQGRMKFW